ARLGQAPAGAGTAGRGHRTHGREIPRGVAPVDRHRAGPRQRRRAWRGAEMNSALVGVVMGSSSDWDVMQHAVAVLEEFGVPHEARVVSAHRMPDDMFDYAASARGRGLRAIVAGAGGAAHLPGMLAAKTTLPVLGVPVPSK